MLGGGVAAQGERLTVPVQKILDKEVFGGNDRARVEVVCATLGNLAGALGAAALVI
jgi:predicted NBD/HSP70 family sugar kinase